MGGELKKEPNQPQRLEGGEIVEVGTWYWVKESRGDVDDGSRKKEWFGCIIHIGSNYVELRSPKKDHGGYTYTRVHFTDFDKRLRREENPKAVIQGRIGYFKKEVETKLAEVRAITARLGVSAGDKIEQTADPSNRSLIALSGTDNVKKYKKDLIRAKDKSLPKLFEEIKSANSSLSKWMSAEVVPLEAFAEAAEGCIEEVKDRIFNVKLYAGLTEDLEHVVEGKPAPLSEKLHLMQRRLYMDEESLLNYKHGGMEFGNIESFDKWIGESENMKRLLPFPRCMVAFRVRRNTKEREFNGSLYQFFVNFRLEEADKLTFLYIRNGENLYRMDCDLEFGHMIFPDRGEFDPSEPMMVHVRFSDIEKIIPVREYEQYIKDDKERKKKEAEWNRTHPKKDHWHNPFNHSSFDPDDWEPFTPESVYYDDAKVEIESRIKQYNRIVLIVQGLLDRSPVLHPHPPAKLWTAEGFQSAIKLVYDGGDTIHYGEAPSFEAYRDKCNAKLKEGCVTVGQQRYWEKVQTKMYNDRNPYREREVGYHVPYGNPGPGYFAKIAMWHKRVRKATYRWTRKRQNYGGYFSNARPGDPMPCKFSAPADRIFNIDAYKPGDYKQFFVDPRTRAQYLRWAPLLLAAEEYHAGNLTIEDNVEHGSLAEKTKKRKKKRKK